MNRRLLIISRKSSWRLKIRACLLSTHAQWQNRLWNFIYLHTVGYMLLEKKEKHWRGASDYLSVFGINFNSLCTFFHINIKKTLISYTSRSVVVVVEVLTWDLARSMDLTCETMWYSLQLVHETLWNYVNYYTCHHHPSLCCGRKLWWAMGELQCTSGNNNNKKWQ